MNKQDRQNTRETILIFTGLASGTMFGILIGMAVFAWLKKKIIQTMKD